MNLHLDWASHATAKYAVENWHYSRRMPKSKLVKIGAWEDDKFIGVVIFGLGATALLGKPYGLNTFQFCELVRIALRGHKTPVSRIVRIALSMLKKHSPGLKLVISFADPGEGHAGGIYKAGNWIYAGETPDCKFPILDGRVVHPRVLSLRVRSGKAKRDEVDYIEKPGKHRYLMPLDESTRAIAIKFNKPYPSASEVNEDMPGHHLGKGGATPTRTLPLDSVE